MAGLKALITPVKPEPPAVSLIRSARTPPDETNGRWTNGFAFQPYTNSKAWLADRCGSTITDSPAQGAPGGVAVATSQGGGTLGTVGSTTVYGYKVASINGNGTSTPSAEATVTVPSQVTTATAKNTVSWNAIPGATGYNVYGRTSGGPWLKMNVTPVTTLSFLDDGSVTPAGAVAGSDTTGGPGTYSHPAEVDWVPAAYHHSDYCSAFGYLDHDFRDRAKVALDIATAKAVELEFWAGAFAAANSHPNLYLTKAGLATDLTPGAGVPSRNRGFEILEQGLADAGAGGRGFIHCRAGETPSFVGIRRDGNLLLSPRDTIVVPGSGYPNIGPGGSVPAAGQAWMFATGMVEYRVDTEQWYPDVNSPEELPMAVDRDTNTINFRVAKFAAAYWDGTVTLACRVTTDA